MSTSRSIQARKQRRAGFRASSFVRQRQMTVALSRELRARYKRRALPLRKGDTVRVVSGSYKGREERVSKVDRRSLSVTLDNVSVKKVDQKLKPLPIRSNHLILTRLNLIDPWRREILKVTEAEIPPEETPAPAPEPTSETAAPATEAPAPAGEATAEEPAAPAAEAEPAPAPPKKRRARTKPAEETE